MKKKMFYSGLAFSLAITGAIATNAIADTGGSFSYGGASLAAGRYLSVGVKNDGTVFGAGKLHEEHSRKTLLHILDSIVPSFFETTSWGVIENPFLFENTWYPMADHPEDQFDEAFDSSGINGQVKTTDEYPRVILPKDKYKNGVSYTGITEWADIVQVAISKNDSYPKLLGLKTDGTVRHYSLDNIRYVGGLSRCGMRTNRCKSPKNRGVFVFEKHTDNFQEWEDIKQVAMGADHAIGLTNDGFVVATGNRGAFAGTENWENIVQISAGYNYTVGVDSDGRVVATGTLKGRSLDEYSLSDWYDIKQVAVYANHIVGLTGSGTVVTYGNETRGAMNVGHWTDVIQVAAGWAFTVGLKADGTVLFAGNGVENVTEWTDIVQIAAGGWHVVGMKSDGTMVSLGANKNDQTEVKGTNLFPIHPSFYMETKDECEGVGGLWANYTCNSSLPCDSGAQTVKKDGFTWMRCDAGGMPHPEAKAYCNSLALDGYKDWKLPNSDELATLIDESQRPTIDNDLFECNEGRYWTSTKAQEGWKRFLTHNFRMGTINEAQTHNHNHYVRCVHE